MARLVRSAAPVEVRVCVLLMGAGAVVFLLLGVLRLAVEGGAGVLWLPAVLAFVTLPVVAGLVAAVRLARPAGMALVAVVALLLMLTVLGPAPWWVRLFAGVLAAVYGYVFVLLNTGAVRGYVGGDR